MHNRERRWTWPNESAIVYTQRPSFNKTQNLCNSSYNSSTEHSLRLQVQSLSQELAARDATIFMLRQQIHELSSATLQAASIQTPSAQISQTVSEDPVSNRYDMQCASPKHPSMASGVSRTEFFQEFDTVRDAIGHAQYSMRSDISILTKQVQQLAIELRKVTPTNQNDQQKAEYQLDQYNFQDQMDSSNTGCSDRTETDNIRDRRGSIYDEPWIAQNIIDDLQPRIDHSQPVDTDNMMATTEFIQNLNHEEQSLQSVGQEWEDEEQSIQSIAHEVGEEQNTESVSHEEEEEQSIESVAHQKEEQQSTESVTPEEEEEQSIESVEQPFATSSSSGINISSSISHHGDLYSPSSTVQDTEKETKQPLWDDVYQKSEPVHCTRAQTPQRMFAYTNENGMISDINHPTIVQGKQNRSTSCTRCGSESLEDASIPASTAMSITHIANQDLQNFYGNKYCRTCCSYLYDSSPTSSHGSPRTNTSLSNLSRPIPNPLRSPKRPPTERAATAYKKFVDRTRSCRNASALKASPTRSNSVNIQSHQKRSPVKYLLHSPTQHAFFSNKSKSAMKNDRVVYRPIQMSPPWKIYKGTTNIQR